MLKCGFIVLLESLLEVSLSIVLTGRVTNDSLPTDASIIVDSIYTIVASLTDFVFLESTVPAL